MAAKIVYTNFKINISNNFSNFEKPVSLEFNDILFLSILKDYISYTFTNTPPPPLSNVQSGEVFF